MLGSVVYWGGYVKNGHATEDMENLCLYIDPNTEHPDDEVNIGLDPAGLNGTMQTIPNINTSPADVEFFLAPSYNQGVFIGKLKVGQTYPFWLRRNLNETREELKRNLFDVCIGFDPPKGSTGGGSGGGSGGGGGGPPPGPAPGDFSVGWNADWGTSSGTKSTINNMTNFMNGDPTYLSNVVPGDISYQSTADKWISMTAALRSGSRKMYWCPGNHEYSDGKGLINQYKQLFGGSKTFTSATIGNMFILGADMYVSFSSGSEQYNFLKGEMERIKNNSSILWRVLYFHEPLYSAKSDHGNNSKFRDLYHPLMDANGFDLMVNGHNHNYQRSYPLRYNSGSPSSPTIHNTGDPAYTNPDGVIEITCGLGGHDVVYGLDSSPSWNAFQEDSYFGFFQTTISNNGRTLTGKGYKNDGTLFDTFSITK